MAEELIIEEKTSRYSSLQDYCGVVFRHKWAALVLFLLILAAASAFVVFSRDLYRSEAKLLVRLGWESINPDPTVATGERAGSINQPLTVQLNTVLDIIKSQTIAEQVVDRVGPERFFAPFAGSAKEAPGNEAGSSILGKVQSAVRKVGDMGEEFFSKEEGEQGPVLRDRAVRILMNYMDAELLRNTRIISISFAAPVPELAQDVVKALTEQYLDKHKLVYRNPGSLNFLEDQEKETRARLEGIEKKIQALKKENNLISLENRLQLVETNIGALEQEIDKSEADLCASRARIEDLEKKLAGMPEKLKTGESSSKDFSIIDSLETLLLDLKGKEQEALSKFTENSESVKEIRRRIADVRKRLEEAKPRVLTTENWGLNTARQQVESALRTEEAAMASLEARCGELKRQLAASKKEREHLIDVQFKISRLDLDLEKEKTSYRKITEGLNQARMEQTLEEKRVSNISIVQPATFPLEPENSRKILILLAGILGGIFGGIVLAFVLDSMDHTLRTPEEAEQKLQVPTLAAIPRVRANRVNLKTKVG